MNAGFSNLDTLRKKLLAGSLMGETKFDPQITLIGLGMAGAIESLLNRKLARVAGDIEVLPADRNNFVLSRYPLETLTLTELKIIESDGWVAQDASVIKAVDTANGIVNWRGDCDAGPDYAQVRFTYTGGFFWETAEPDDAGYPTAIPAGAALLPDAIRQAWLLQCQQVWAACDKLGLGLADEPDKQSKLADIKPSPLIKQMLTSYIRYQMT